jgi:hypothetical protein
MKYTKEHEDQLRSLYTVAQSDKERSKVVSDFSEQWKVSETSIRAKLSSMGIYVKPARTTKSGDPITAKSEYVSAIRILLGAKDHELDSLEKATKRDLQIISERLVALSVNARR